MSIPMHLRKKLLLPSRKLGKTTTLPGGCTRQVRRGPLRRCLETPFGIHPGFRRSRVGRPRPKALARHRSSRRCPPGTGWTKRRDGRSIKVPGISPTMSKYLQSGYSTLFSNKINYEWFKVLHRREIQSRVSASTSAGQWGRRRPPHRRRVPATGSVPGWPRRRAIAGQSCPENAPGDRRRRRATAALPAVPVGRWRVSSTTTAPERIRPARLGTSSRPAAIRRPFPASTRAGPPGGRSSWDGGPASAPDEPPSSACSSSFRTWNLPAAINVSRRWFLTSCANRKFYLKELQLKANPEKGLTIQGFQKRKWVQVTICSSMIDMYHNVKPCLGPCLGTCLLCCLNAIVFQRHPKCECRVKIP